jgi:soluble lytic murein transglycosylase-like protein
MLRLVLPLAGLLALLTPSARAQPAETADWARCRNAIAAAEPGSGIPPGLLGAIALVESGQRNPRTGAPEAWPWSYNVAGEGHAAPSKAAAIAEVSALLARGQRSVDVGCMQVNLLHHPDAFRNLDEAFDPAVNLRYATRFLRDLRARTGDWGQAIARYHSGEAERGAAYNRRVALARMGAAWGRGGGVPLPPQVVQNICAQGLTPMLLFGGAQEARRFMTPEARRAQHAVPLPPPSNRPRLACVRNTARR